MKVIPKWFKGDIIFYLSSWEEIHRIKVRTPLKKEMKGEEYFVDFLNKNSNNFFAEIFKNTISLLGEEEVYKKLNEIGVFIGLK